MKAVESKGRHTEQEESSRVVWQKIRIEGAAANDPLPFAHVLRLHHAISLGVRLAQFIFLPFPTSVLLNFQGSSGVNYHCLPLNLDLPFPHWNGPLASTHHAYHTTTSTRACLYSFQLKPDHQSKS
jgi:hypothetical protein